MKLIRSFAIAYLACAASLPAATPAIPDRDAALLGPMAPRLHSLVGTWQVKAELRFAPAAKPVTIDAVAENRLIGGRWLISELKGRDSMGMFHGVGVNGFDPVKGKYEGYWIDNTRSLLIPVEGEYDAKASVFRTVSLERDSKGHMNKVLSKTRIISPDKEVTTFTAEDAKGRRFTRMVLSYDRAAAAN